ncbi:hypothetical protein ACV3J6_22060, partial [Salmonella enterica subsp. houtenae serovar 16:z4,z23:-]
MRLSVRWKKDRKLQFRLALFTGGRSRKNGLSPKSIVDGLRFPLNNNYELSIVLLRHEATGVLLGPITVSSMVYNVYCGAIK